MIKIVNAARCIRLGTRYSINVSASGVSAFPSHREVRCRDLCPPSRETVAARARTGAAVSSINPWETETKSNEVVSARRCATRNALKASSSLRGAVYVYNAFDDCVSTSEMRVVMITRFSREHNGIRHQRIVNVNKQEKKSKNKSRVRIALYVLHEYAIGPETSSEHDDPDRRSAGLAVAH